MVKQALDRESMQALIKQDAIDRGGDRTTKKPGAVAMGFSQGSLKVVYDAEPEEPMCIVSFVNRFYYCTAMDRSRSYIYVREGALEMNHSYKRAICCYVCPDGVGEDYLRHVRKELDRFRIAFTGQPIALIGTPELTKWIYALPYVPETKGKTLEELDDVFGDATGQEEHEVMRIVAAEARRR